MRQRGAPPVHVDRKSSESDRDREKFIEKALEQRRAREKPKGE
jgi:hypothetical protein